MLWRPILWECDERPPLSNSIEGSPAENNTLGVWLTRGGWHGHEHFALESTNSDADTLAQAATRQGCGTVAALDSGTWQICRRVGS